MTDILTDRWLELLTQEITLAFTSNKRLTLNYAMRGPAEKGLQLIVGHYQALRTEHAALREIAEAVAEKGGVYYWAGDNICMYCEARTLAGMTGLEDDAVRHTPDCPVTKARALLGIEPGA